MYECMYVYTRKTPMQFLLDHIEKKGSKKKQMAVVEMSNLSVTFPL